MERNWDGGGEKKSRQCSPIYHALSRPRVNWKLNIVKAVTHLHDGDVAAELSGLLRRQLRMNHTQIISLHNFHAFAHSRGLRGRTEKLTPRQCRAGPEAR